MNSEEERQAKDKLEAKWLRPVRKAFAWRKQVES